MSLSSDGTYVLLNYLACSVDAEHHLERIRRKLAQQPFDPCGAFHCLDRRSAGCISASDLAAFLCQYAPGLTEECVSVLYCHMDKDGDGEISPPDFLETVLPCDLGLRQLVQSRQKFSQFAPPPLEVQQTLGLLLVKEAEACRELEFKKTNMRQRAGFTPQRAFDFLDFFREGVLTCNGVYQIWSQYCPDLTNSDLKALFRRFDRDRDGVIAYEEFLRSVEACPHAGVPALPGTAAGAVGGAMALQPGVAGAVPGAAGGVGVVGVGGSPATGPGPAAAGAGLGAPQPFTGERGGNVKVYVGQLRLKYFDLGPVVGRNAAHLFLLAHNCDHELEGVPVDPEKLDGTWAPVKRRLVESGDNPSGTLPVLYAEGRCLSGSTPILRFLAKKLGKYGLDLWRDTTADVVCDRTDEWRSDIQQHFAHLFSPTVGKSDAYTLGVRQRHYDCLEAWLSKSGQDFYTGADVHYCDFAVWACLWDDLKLRGTSLIEVHPRLLNLYAKIRNLPGIDAWASSTHVKGGTGNAAVLR